LQEIDPMTKVVTSLFHSEQHATAAANGLEQAGIPREEIDIWSTPHNLAPLLEDEGVSRADAHAYAEGVLRGGSLVIVKCGDAEVDQVVSILDQEGVLDLDEQQAAWRSEGCQENATAGLAGGPAMSSGSAADMAPTGRAGEVDHGRVRIQPRSTESPEQD
jgi:hypothetical protein